MVTEWKKCGLVSLQTLVVLWYKKMQQKLMKAKVKAKKKLAEAKGDKHVRQPELHVATLSGAFGVMSCPNHNIGFSTWLKGVQQVPVPPPGPRL